MKKQFAAIFAATAVLGVTTAFAANPFSDVTPDSWAYQAVSQLAASGIVNGYPDGTFKGQNDITRYEMAQMIAKAMANQDRANAEQQAMINRLADEFSNELNNLGVRVARLEDRVGNVKVTGDMRLRFLGSQNKDGIYANYYGDYSKSSQFDGRARLQFNAKVNDRTDAVVRVVTGDYEFGDADTYSYTGVNFDRAYVNHKFGERVSIKAGRFGQMMGAGLAFDGTFDGVQFNAGNEKINLQAAYGYGVSGKLEGKVTKGNPPLVVLNLNSQLNKHVNLGGFYTRINGGDHSTTPFAPGGIGVAYKNIYGFNADVKLHKVWIGGEWLRTSNIKNSQAWVAGIGYGNYDQAKQGTWDVKAQYFNQKEDAPILDTTWDHIYTAGYKGWMATADYALQDNVGLTAYYGFNWKEYKDNGKDQPNFYRVDLNYQF